MQSDSFVPDAILILMLVLVIVFQQWGGRPSRNVLVKDGCRSFKVVHRPAVFDDSPKTAVHNQVRCSVPCPCTR